MHTFAKLNKDNTVETLGVYNDANEMEQALRLYVETLDPKVFKTKDLDLSQKVVLIFRKVRGSIWGQWEPELEYTLLSVEGVSNEEKKGEKENVEDELRKKIGDLMASLEYAEENKDLSDIRHAREMTELETSYKHEMKLLEKDIIFSNEQMRELKRENDGLKKKLSSEVEKYKEAVKTSMSSMTKEINDRVKARLESSEPDVKKYVSHDEGRDSLLKSIQELGNDNPFLTSGVHLQTEKKSSSDEETGPFDHEYEDGEESVPNTEEVVSEDEKESKEVDIGEQYMTKLFHRSQPCKPRRYTRGNGARGRGNGARGRGSNQRRRK